MSGVDFSQTGPSWYNRDDTSRQKVVSHVNMAFDCNIGYNKAKTF